MSKAVRLSALEVDIARRAGVSLRDYARAKAGLGPTPEPRVPESQRCSAIRVYGFGGKGLAS